MQHTIQIQGRPKQSWPFLLLHWWSQNVLPWGFHLQMLIFNNSSIATNEMHSQITVSHKYSKSSLISLIIPSPHTIVTVTVHNHYNNYCYNNIIVFLWRAANIIFHEEKKNYFNIPEKRSTRMGLVVDLVGARTNSSPSLLCSPNFFFTAKAKLLFLWMIYMK